MAKTGWDGATEIVRAAGGSVVGRTKLQKVAYLLELAGLGEGFRFAYRHYGPFSEALANSIRIASAFGMVDETERQASWGGTYSVYTVKDAQSVSDLRSEFASAAAGIDSVELELAATAAYLSSVEGFSDPWVETARRKPEKAGGGRLARAKDAYRKLLAMKTPKQLPRIV